MGKKDWLESDWTLVDKSQTPSGCGSRCPETNEFYKESMMKDPWDAELDVHPSSSGGATETNKAKESIIEELRKIAQNNSDCDKKPSKKDDKQCDEAVYFNPDPKPRYVPPHKRNNQERTNRSDLRKNREVSEDVGRLTTARSHQQHQKSNQDDVRLSKALSAVLMGFTVGSDGYLKVDEILQHSHFKRSLHATKEDIIRVVESNDKQRFTLSTNSKGEDLIRANQGHSVEVDNLQMDVITDASLYPTVVHGTYRTAVPAIKQDGLHKMKRNHIHMTTGIPTDNTSVISGMRKSCNAFIYIDIKAAIKDGIRFFLSSNQVILCEGNSDGYLLPKYFERIDFK